MNFLDEKDGLDELDKTDLLAGRRGRTGTRLDRTHSFKLNSHHGKKEAIGYLNEIDSLFLICYK